MRKSEKEAAKSLTTGVQYPRGLLDDEALSYSPTQTIHPESISWLPPFLLTASRESLLVYCARILEEIMASRAHKPKRRGRPTSVVSGLDVDSKRAWIIWWYVRQCREAGAFDAEKMTVSQLILEARKFPGGEKLFPMETTTENRLLSSVSDGKTKMHIGKDWLSETCEKLLPFIRNS